MNPVFDRKLRQRVNATSDTGIIHGHIQATVPGDDGLDRRLRRRGVRRIPANEDGTRASLGDVRGDPSSAAFVDIDDRHSSAFAREPMTELLVARLVLCAKIKRSSECSERVPHLRRWRYCTWLLGNLIW